MLPNPSFTPGTALRLYKATGFLDRLRGLHAYPPLAGDTGLFLAPCRAVHTVGLRYSIDVVFLDRHGRVIRRVEALPPARMAWCLQSVSVVELPAGYCRAQPDYERAIRAALGMA
jgi:uncharacterized membrane protein (UPF0127 family)